MVMSGRMDGGDDVGRMGSWHRCRTANVMPGCRGGSSLRSRCHSFRCGCSFRGGSCRRRGETRRGRDIRTSGGRRGEFPCADEAVLVGRGRLSGRCGTGQKKRRGQNEKNGFLFHDRYLLGKIRGKIIRGKTEWILYFCGVFGERFWKIEMRGTPDVCFAFSAFAISGCGKIEMRGQGCIYALPFWHLR